MEHTTEVDRVGQIWFTAERITGFATVAESDEFRTQYAAQQWTRQQLDQHPQDLVSVTAGLYGRDGFVPIRQAAAFLLVEYRRTMTNWLAP